MLDMSGWIREMESMGGAYVSQKDQKDLWLWLSTLDPEQRLYWFKRVLAFPLSTRVLTFATARKSSPQMNHVMPDFFSLTHYVQHAFSGQYAEDGETIQDSLAASFIVLSPFYKTLWDVRSGAIQCGDYRGTLQGGSYYEGSPIIQRSYVFAASLLDILSPCIEKHPEVSELIKRGEPNPNQAVPTPLRVYIRERRPIAAITYRLLMQQCVEYTDLKSVKTLNTKVR